MEELLKEHYFIIIICLSVISTLLFIIVLIDQFCIKKEMSKEIKELKSKIQDYNTSNNKNVRPSQNQPDNTQRQVVRQQNSYQQPANHITHINQQVANNEGITINKTNTSQNNNEDVSSEVPVVTNQTTNLFAYNYLQEANSGKFLRLMSAPDKCFFRTWEEGGVRKYEFCGNVAKALANINAIFDDVCEIEGKRSDATDIENVAAGTLDSELKIINKARIRLK